MITIIFLHVTQYVQVQKIKTNTKMKFENENQTFYSIIWFFCSNPYDIFVHTMLSWLLMILEIFIPWSCLSKSVLAKAFYYIHPDIKKVIFDITHRENPAVFIVNVFWKINKTTYGTSILTFKYKNQLKSSDRNELVS